MKKVIFLTLILTACIGGIISCSKSGAVNNNNTTTTVDCSTTPKTFTEANPVFQAFCNQAACHNAGSTNGPGPLTNYTEIFNARAAIRSAVATGLMPQNTTLSTTQKNTILCWIDNGAQNN